MKQIEDMFGRFIADRPRLKRKWQMAFLRQEGVVSLVFYHYHHMIAIYVEGEGFVHEWYQVPADKRGLDAIKHYMQTDAKNLVFSRIREGSTHYEIQTENSR